MEIKKCNKCQIEKNINLFSKNQKQCKECVKQYYQKDKERIKLKTKNRYENNKALILDNQKQYYQKNKDKIKYIAKEWIKNKYKNNEEFRIQTKLNLQIIKYLRQHQNINKCQRL